MIMPTEIGRDELRDLTGQRAQLVEVLPADEYDWAHLPGAVNLPLEDLDAGTGRRRPLPAGHRVLPRLALRHEPTGRVAARSSRVQPGV